MPIALICPICAKTSFKKPSRINNPSCSNACGQIFRSQNSIKKFSKEQLFNLYWKQNKSLRQIGKVLNSDPSHLKNIFRKLKIELRHGSEAIKTQWIDNEKRKTQARELMKKINPNRNRTEVYKKCRTRGTIEWSKKIRARDLLCQICKSKEKLHAHHIKNIIDFPELKTDMLNGITLCASCHVKTHKNILS